MEYVVKDKLGQSFVVVADRYELVSCDGSDSVATFFGGPLVDSDNIAFTAINPSVVYIRTV